MAKRNSRITQFEMDKLFLLQSLDRLKDPKQRYVFTQIADLISYGLAATGDRPPSKPARSNGRSVSAPRRANRAAR